MTIRITGMNSGLDTESIITELASARSVKVENIKKDQTKLSWKIDAWKELNSKIYSFYTDVLSDMRFDYAYSKKTTKVSDPNAVTVLTSGSAMNGVQEMKVREIAKTGYLTGGKLYAVSGGKRVAASGNTRLSSLEGMDWLKDGGQSISFKVTVGGEKKEIKLTDADTLNDLARKFKEAGLDARFDETTGRLFVVSKESGEEADFKIEAALTELTEPEYAKVPDMWDDTDDATWNMLSHADRLALIETFGDDGLSEADKQAAAADKDKVKEAYEKERQSVIDSNAALKADYEEKLNNLDETHKQEQENFLKALSGLGMMTKDIADANGISVDEEKIAHKIDGKDAVIELNGATFKSSSNAFEINGLTITVHKETGDDPIILTTEQDTSGIYDMIKNFIVKYNELINEMDKLYNAESASKYKPLSNEEKDAMSDAEVEEWEKKIKESLLRRDGTLSSVSSAMKEVMLSTFVSDTNGKNEGKNKYLSYFGIETLGYFKAKDNEKSAYHINGDADDTNVKNAEEKLRKAIANEPDTVIEFFKKLSNDLYDKLTEKMERSDYSSSFTVYNDKQMDTELKKYESKIKTEQDKLNDYIDRWYKKFSQMEVALSKLNSKESSISSLFG